MVHRADLLDTPRKALIPTVLRPDTEVNDIRLSGSALEAVHGGGVTRGERLDATAPRR